MKKIIILLFLILSSVNVQASPPSRIFTYTSGSTINPDEVTANEDAIFNYLNRQIEGVEDNSVTTTKILDGTILNADIATTAAIVDSKLAQITTANKVNASAITGTLGVTNGGTGVTTLTGIVKGNGTSAFSAATAGTDYVVAGTAMAAGDLYTVAWTDYSATSTIVGWSGFTTKYVYYKKVGNIVFVAFSLIGTSDATTISFTVPYTIAVLPMQISSCYGMDSSTSVTGSCKIVINNNNTLIQVTKDMAAGAWTNSGTKEVTGGFWYELKP